MTESIEIKLRDLCDALQGTTTPIDFADIVPLLREAYETIEDQRLVTRKLYHCVQSSWKCLPDEIVERFANDETIASENRLPNAVTAVSLLAAKLPE